jgi:hypothetical protein
LVVLNVSQVHYTSIDLPGPQGIIVVEWTPELNKPPIFNHFINFPLRVLLANGYVSYSQPVLQLSIGATHHVISKPVHYVARRKQVIVAFWRHVGEYFEGGIYLNGDLVGHTWEKARLYKTWNGPGWIGARDWTPVLDPTFPGCAHIDGSMSAWLFR